MINHNPMEQLKQENERLKASLAFVCQLNEILLKYRQNLLDLVASCDCYQREKQRQVIGNLEKSYNQLNSSYKPDTNNVQDEYDNDEEGDPINLFESEDEQIREPKDKAVKQRQSRGRKTKKVDYCEAEDVIETGEVTVKIEKEDDVDNPEEPSKSEGVKRRKRNSYDLSKFKVNEEGKILGLDKPKWMRGQAGFYCDYPGCDFFGKKRIDLVEHMAEHTGETSEYVCGQCKRSFNKKSNWIAHSKVTHSFACDMKDCERSFPTLGKLNQHKLKQHLHQDKRPFKCDWPNCDYRGKDRWCVSSHRRTHTGEKPFKCTHEGCQKSFTFQNALKDHLLSHSDYCPFKCPWPGCESAHKRKENLKKHLLTHTGQKEVKCDWPGCEYQCSNCRNLSRHRNFVHLGIRNYSCTWPGCEKKFFSNSKLKAHMCTHTGEKPIKCAFQGCDKKFILKHNMISHMRAMHERNAGRSTAKVSGAK